MTLPASIRVNVVARFPAQVNVTGFLTLAKANGVWSFGSTFLNFTTIPAGLLGTAIVPTQDPGSGLFYATTVAAIAALAAAPTSTSRVVTVAPGGIITALASDGDLLINLTIPAAVTVNLVNASTITGQIFIKDLAGNASTFPITIAPVGGQTIDGSTSSIRIASDGGAVTLRPIPALTGYYQK